MVKVGGWQGRPPKFPWDLLPFHVAFTLPRNAYNLIYWTVRWKYLFDYKKLPYGYAEKEYLTSQALRPFGMDWNKFMQMPEEERKEHVAKELWKPANMADFKRALIQKHSMLLFVFCWASECIRFFKFQRGKHHTSGRKSIGSRGGNLFCSGLTLEKNEPV